MRYISYSTKELFVQLFSLSDHPYDKKIRTHRRGRLDNLKFPLGVVARINESTFARHFLAAELFCSDTYDVQPTSSHLSTTLSDEPCI